MKNEDRLLVEGFERILMDKGFRSCGSFKFVGGSDCFTDLEVEMDLDHGDDGKALRIIIKDCDVFPAQNTGDSPHACLALDREGARQMGAFMLAYQNVDELLEGADAHDWMLPEVAPVGQWVLGYWSQLSDELGPYSVLRRTQDGSWETQTANCSTPTRWRNIDTYPGDKP